MSNLADIALAAGRLDRKGQQAVNIIEFIESSWGLNIPLYPVQRVILKAHYGLPLDDNPWGIDITKPVPLDHPNYNEIAFLPDDEEASPPESVEEDGFQVTPEEAPEPEEAGMEDETGFYRYRVKVTDWRRENVRYMTEAGYLRYLYDQGRCNIKEVIPGQERRELVLSIGRRSGKCILGDSLVLTDQGIRRIEDMGDPDGPEVQPLEVGVAQEGPKQSRSAYFYNGGVKATRTLTTHCGYRLGGTDNHRIKVLSEAGKVEWKYLADLQVGDVVCIHRNTNLWASEYLDCTPYHNDQGYKELIFPGQLTEDWGRLLGYLVGDGLWNYKGRVEVTVEHDETWETLKGLYTKLFRDYSVVMDKRTGNTGCIKFNSVGMRTFLHDLGFRLGTDRDAKMVPWAILQSPRPVVQAFLRGLFEADGGVEADGKVVSFSTASGRLAREVQTLLLNLGIVSRIRPKTVTGKVYWRLTIQGLRHRTAFAERVGFDSHKKMNPLLASLAEVGREGGDAESIPHQRDWCRRLLDSVPKGSRHTGKGWERSSLRQVLGNTIKPSATDEMTYPRLAEVLPVARALRADSEVVAHFEHLVGLDYFFDPVETIEEGFNPVFDLTVPDGESFVANGMTNHNTFICACVMAYEVYKLILKDNPQRYYGIPKTNVIQLISVATDKDQAGLLYNEASGHFSNSAFYKPYTANNTMSYAKFQSPEDIARFGRYADDPSAKATIKVSFKSCVAKGLRGAGNIVIILDELAHFNDVGQSDALTIYRAVKPSLAAFSPKDPNNRRRAIGKVEGRILSISSPLGKQGFFYRKYRQGFAGGLESRNMLCIQAPTWEVNPTVEATFLAEEYATDPDSFFTEFGADFTDRTKGWLSPEALLACVDPKHRPAPKAPARAPHFMGIDIAAGLRDGDYCAVAIGHIDDQSRVVLDHIERIRAGEGEYKDLERLSFDEITGWLYGLSRRFYIEKGLFDQWAGLPFEAALHKRGLTQCESVFFTKQLSSQIFANFKTLVFEKRLRLFDIPTNPADPNSHSDYIEELLELQAEMQSKYIIDVAAPNVPGKHDDLSDALVRMVWEATQRMGNRKYIAGSMDRGSLAHGAMSASDMAKARWRALNRGRLGGSSPDRQRSGINHGLARGRR